MIGWAVIGFSALALSESFYAEISTGFSPTQAFGLHQQFVSAGMTVRLVRRYRQGMGWEYLLSSPQFETVEAARSHAEHWMELASGGVTIYRDSAPEQGLHSLEGAPPLPSVEVLLARLSRLLGGVGGGADRLSAAEGLQFVYEREVFEGERHFLARHSYRERGVSKELGTEPLNGEGLRSRALLEGERARMWTGDAEAQSVDSEAVAGLLDEMGPLGVFSFVLELPRLLGDRGLYDSLQVVDTTSCDGRECAVLASVGEKWGVQLVVDPVDWWLLEASLLGDMGLVVYRFRDWREIDTNLVVPFEFELVRDKQVLEKIRVLEFSLENRG